METYTHDIIYSLMEMLYSKDRDTIHLAVGIMKGLEEKDRDMIVDKLKSDPKSGWSEQIHRSAHINGKNYDIPFLVKKFKDNSSFINVSEHYWLNISKDELWRNGLIEEEHEY